MEQRESKSLEKLQILSNHEKERGRERKKERDYKSITVLFNIVDVSLEFTWDLDIEWKEMVLQNWYESLSNNWTM